MECIVLAGGLGTRLHSVTKDAMPKCMAPVNEQPFLYYLFQYLSQQKIDKVILALGHKADNVLDWIKKNNFPFAMDYVIEKEPLGTGGAIQLALKKSAKEQVLILNGDTLFLADLHLLFEAHIEKQAATTIALKSMNEYDRYGTVVMDDDDCITAFREKSYTKYGAINAGIYILNKKFLLEKNLPEKFSFEKDYLEASVQEKQFFGKIFDNYFIDIGIPEDYEKAQQDFITLFS